MKTCPVSVHHQLGNEWAALARSVGLPVGPRLHVAVARAEAAELARAFDASLRAREFEAWKAELYEQQKRGRP